MGAAESRTLTSTTADSSIRGRVGFHVLRVADNSPAATAMIDVFFDYIVGVDGRALSSESMEASTSGNIEEMLANVVEMHEGRELNLQVWSSKRAELRDVTVVPSRHWSADNSGETSQASLEESQPSLLGLSLRLCNPDGALEKVWHVLEILDNSPAESAGLVPFGDYILGYSNGVLHKESDFYKLVEEHIDKPLRLFVYNSDFDVTREVVIVPNRAWSSGNEGQGLLGCGVGYGVLHRIPKPKPVDLQQQQQQQLQTGKISNGNGYNIDSPTASAGVSIQPSSSPSFSPSVPPKQPTRMQASIVSASSPQTPPRPTSPSNYPRPQQQQQTQTQGYKGYTAPDQSARLGSPSRIGGGMMTAPPRSPSGMSHRSSVAEVIAEEEE